MDESFTYILRCADGTLYTGWTRDLNRRLTTHNKGTGSKYTRSRRPVELIWWERFDSREEAMRRECCIKKLSRREKLALIEGKRTDGEETSPNRNAES